jgi:hypothetical protein
VNLNWAAIGKWLARVIAPAAVAKVAEKVTVVKPASPASTTDGV